MSTRRFVQQIEWLRKRFEIVSLEEAQTRIARGKNDRPTACITFDDGYAENMNFAVPLLLRHKIPFTYFVATSYLLQSRPFPHDVQANQPLPPNSLSDLRFMASQGVEIGAHTRSHCNLGLRLSENQLADEILGSKHDIEQVIDQNVRYFAFPYGLPENMTSDAFRIAFNAGFSGVCSAYGAYNLPGDDAFHLRRFHADPEMIRWKNWLTIDRRKLRSQSGFDPGDFRACPPGQGVAANQSAGPVLLPSVSLPLTPTEHPIS